VLQTLAVLWHSALPAAVQPHQSVLKSKSNTSKQNINTLQWAGIAFFYEVRRKKIDCEKDIIFKSTAELHIQLLKLVMEAVRTSEMSVFFN
jgi:hypothetical protein